METQQSRQLSADKWREITKILVTVQGLDEPGPKLTRLLGSLPDGWAARVPTRASSPYDYFINIVQWLDQQAGYFYDHGMKKHALVVFMYGVLDEVPAGSTVAKRLEDTIAELEQLYLGSSPPDSPGIDEPPPTIPAASMAFLAKNEPDGRVTPEYFEKGKLAGGGVALVHVQKIVGEKVVGVRRFNGCGWVIAPGIVCTNYHVIHRRQKGVEPPATDLDFELQATRAVLQFPRGEPGSRWARCTKLLHASKERDYALLRFDDTEVPKQPLRLARTGSRLKKHALLNVLQSLERGVEYLIRGNFFIEERQAELGRIVYMSSTEPGSSGSPVLNDEWQVVALHRAGWPRETDQHGNVANYSRSEGVLLDAILADLPSHLRNEIEKAQAEAVAASPH